MIEAWTVHCPGCDLEVEVAADAPLTRCPGCERTFQAEGLETTIRDARPKPIDPDDPLVGERLGRWRIARVLGRGGMGRVYEAHDRFRRRRVALKVLREDLASDDSFVKRFHREAKVLAAMTHPHIVSVVDQGQDEGHVWFAMEHVRGESLRQRMSRGPIPAVEALAIAMQIASGLGYAHERRIVHRDLKPENVLIEEDGTVRIVDFGLSMLHEEKPSGEAATRLTHTDIIMGTYEYMAPEQRRGDRLVDGRADLFALGVILYEMLTGSLPLGRFQLPSERSVDVSRRLDAIVTRALAPEAEHRYASAAELQVDLDQALRGGPDPELPPAAPPHVPNHELEESRSVVRHVEILSALDRVVGIVALLAAMGGLSVAAILGPVWSLNSGGLRNLGTVLMIALFVGAISLIKQGGRLARLEPGSRETQVAWSVFFLFFPPFLTAFGIYGLVQMASDKSRRTFALHPQRRIGVPGGAIVPALHAAQAATPPAPKHAGAKPVRPHVPMPTNTTPSYIAHTTRLKSASWLLRLFLLGSVLWTINAALISIDVMGFEKVGNLQDVARLEAYLKVSAVGSILALAVGVMHLIKHRERRGLALAFFALVLMASSTGLFAGCYDETNRWATTQEGAPTTSSPPSVVPSLPFPH